MSSQTPASKSQQRAAYLLHIAIDAADYTAAGAALEAARVPADGLPKGETWRSAAKLADADLLARLTSAATAESIDYHASSSLDARERRAAYVASTTGMQRRVAAGNAAVAAMDRADGRGRYNADLNDVID